MILFSKLCAQKLIYKNAANYNFYQQFTNNKIKYDIIYCQFFWMLVCIYEYVMHTYVHENIYTYINILNTHSV